MKKKDYFLVKPSAFTRFDNIDIDGRYSYAKCEDFDMLDERENVLIFEVKYYDCANGRYYMGTAKEKITGERFNLQFQNVLNPETGRVESLVTIVSNYLGLRSISLPLSAIWVEPSKISGLLYHFNDDDEAKDEYCSNLKTMFELARERKWLYDTSINGPSRALTSEMKRTYRRAEKLNYEE